MPFILQLNLRTGRKIIDKPANSAHNHVREVGFARKTGCGILNTLVFILLRYFTYLKYITLLLETLPFDRMFISVAVYFTVSNCNNNRDTRDKYAAVWSVSSP